MTRRASLHFPLLLVALLHTFVGAASAQTPPSTPDIPAKYTAPAASYDYIKREVMIAMRDGVKLHTVIVIPKGAKNAPLLLTRTPYNANELTGHAQSPHLGPVLQGYDN